MGTGAKVAHIPKSHPDSSQVSRIGAGREGLSSEEGTEMKGMVASSLCKHSGPGLALCRRAALLKHISCRAAKAFINVLPAKAASAREVWL